MKQRLHVWGYEATERTCKDWLQSYRLGDGAVDGCAALYTLSRQDLQRWYHIEKLTPAQLVDRYRSETGIFADGYNLVKWLKAPEQALSRLENNVSIHGHACGEYVLDQLQNGAKPSDVVEKLLSLYMVETTT